MRRRSLTIVASAFAAGGILGVVFGICVATSQSVVLAQVVAASVGSSNWLQGSLDDKLGQVERQLRGFDVTMAEVGYRYDELAAAAKSRNWDYAQYQAEKIEHSIRLGLERRPKRAKSAEPFLKERVPHLLDVIKSRNSERLDAAITHLHSGCIQCHRAENVLFMGGRFAAIHPPAEAALQVVADFRRQLTPQHLADADRSRGRVLFSTHCANCHRLFGEGATTGPDLGPLQRTNLDYLLAAIVTPNALVGFDYQTVVVATADGRTLSGVIAREDANSLTLQTATELVTIEKGSIDDQSKSDVSIMPEGMLQKLSLADVRDLIGYVQGAEQAPLPAGSQEPSVDAPGKPNDADLIEEGKKRLGVLEGIAPHTLRESAVRLGRRLYWDERLSAGGKTACASCHLAKDWGADARRYSIDARGKPTARNSQTVFNATLQPFLRWTGDRKSAAHQAERSLTGSMGFAVAEDVLPLLKEFGYEADFKVAFERQDAPVSVSNYAAAIEAYEKTLVTPSRFDRYLSGAKDALSDVEKKGLRLFLSVGCANCHEGPVLGGRSIEKFGEVSDYWVATKSEKRDAGVFESSGIDADRYKFRVSMLRNIGKTAPYFHDGSVNDLQNAVQIMAEVQLGERLSESDAVAIVSFLNSLTGEVPAHYSRPKDAPILPE